MGGNSITLSEGGQSRRELARLLPPITSMFYAIATAANPAAGGTVTCDPNPVLHGGNSSCTASANSGYTFTGFSGDCSGNTCNLTNVTSPKSVTAHFHAPHTITAMASPSAGGTVTCTPNPVPHGGNSRCSATANATYVFDRFSGDCNGASCTLTNVTSSKSVTAHFRAAPPIPRAERDALIALYNSTNGAHWTNRSNWRNSGDTDFNAPGTECSWHGVTCNSAKTHVIGVNLANNRLSGPIPNLSSLNQLQSFGVSGNQLSGPIPDLSGLPQLQRFLVRKNQLSGPIPNLSGLPQLQLFLVSENQLSGPIPDLSGLNRLEIFEAGGNQLSGPIPNLSSLNQLQSFNVSENQLSGTIPNLSGLNQLESFRASGNQLSGPIPDLSGLRQLRYFVAGDNQLSGTIPGLSGLSQLQGFFVNDNQLSGTIPNLSGLNRLQRFWVDNNLLTGKPPAAPAGLQANGSRLCPNKLEAPSPTDAAWNTATGSINWHGGCSATAHTVTAQAGPNGSVSPATQQRVHGATAWLAFTPAAGYALDQATPAPSCGPVTITRLGSTSLEIKPIEADCDIQVSFSPILPGQHAIATTANPSAGGTVTCTPNPVPNGSSSTCTASANSGYTFVDFSGDCSGATCSLTNVTSPKRVRANFRATASTTHAIAATANPSAGGSVTCTPNPVPNGGSSTCTASANSGYTFVDFSGDCSGATCSLTNVTSPKSVRANFRATASTTHAITATANPSAGGSVTCSPNPVAHGSNASCTATPAAGYAFDGFGGDCSGNTCSLTNVTSPKAVTARFRLIGAPPSSSATPVPTLGHWALMLLGLLTAALGLQRLRRS